MSLRILDGCGSLIAPSEAERLAALAGAIPDLGDAVGFECRLMANDPTVDLGIRIDRSKAAALDFGHAAFAGDGPWAALQAFVTEWCDTASEYHRWIPALFLELDSTDSLAAPPIPSIFVTLDEPLDRSTTPMRGFAIVSRALERLNGHGVPPETRDCLANCFACLPEAAHVLHVGTMLGRAGAPLRLSVAIPRSDLDRYLSAIGCPEVRPTVEATLHRYAPAARNAHLEIDVGPTIGTRWGLVVRADSPSDWGFLVERLIADRCCDPSKARALLGWPGTWSHSQNRRAMWRDISHLKLTHGASGPESAKAYLVSGYASA